MKKIILSIVVIVALVLAYIFTRPTAVSAPVQEGGTSANLETTNPQTQLNPTPVTTTPPPTTAPKTGLKDGVYTGAVADTIYGPVQVKATITSGKITSVTPLQYPNDREASTRISNTSLPVLEREAIQIQSAKVHLVSGATQTAEGFQQSLADALAQAKA